METLPLSIEAHALSARLAATLARVEIQSVEISAVMSKRREAGDEELELIEMRYQHALALTKFEDVFAEGQLDSK